MLLKASLIYFYLQQTFLLDILLTKTTSKEQHPIIQALQKQDEKQMEQMEQMMSQNWLRPMKEI
ncbi:hypothetical protein FC677_25365 [Bacillus cereus]|nr:hypothetical protein [Bacillus thuringiensis]MRA97560.1 hypothetical protein [Bacillus thuringiensis]RNG45587.1 hypothetical protein EEL55_15910 [Bacillus thuringiensis]RUR61722.1 hypothetical protein ELS81_19025 [Bacillus sp. VKPM B-3276]TKH52200.1 hypothetical protein FC677_25365 [Bacillus cereus]